MRILDDDQAPDGRPFLVMDLLDGETLHARCAAAGGRLAPFEVLRIADRVLDILSATHACGIVHRDIKPSNIFLTVGGGVRILDFGIAAVREELARSAGNELGAVGTPAFMAPEQARWSHGRVDARSDLWAVGATMYYCLAGKHVHPRAATVDDALVFAATQPAPSIAIACPEMGAYRAWSTGRSLCRPTMDGLRPRRCVPRSRSCTTLQTTARP